MIEESVFKEYDIRGTYPSEINEDFAYLIGKSYGSYIQKYFEQKKCVVGYDNRLSSPSLHEALIKGLLESGCNVRDYEEITTPMHYYTRHLNHCFGIMITASHNPKDDNGFKFSLDNLANARGKMIQDFKEFTKQKEFLSGKGLYEKANIEKEYFSYMQKNIKMGNKKVKAVIDPGNGVTALFAKKIHDLFPNIEATYICNESDGTFPNHHPDPAVEENLKMLKETVIKTHAEIGIAYDGDGDRIGIVDENGKVIFADEFMIIIIRDIIKNVKNKTFLYDVKCSKSLEDEIKKLGGIPYCYRTGTSYTEAETKKLNLAFGGEYSGHIFFNDRDYALGSGIYAGLRILEILSKTEKKTSELLEGITHYYATPEIKISSSNEEKFTIVDKVLNYVKEKGYTYNDIDGVRISFEEGWALVRASNTGPNLTLRFEGKTEEFMEKLKKEFMDLVESLKS